MNSLLREICAMLKEENTDASLGIKTEIENLGATPITENEAKYEANLDALNKRTNFVSFNALTALITLLA